MNNTDVTPIAKTLTRILTHGPLFGNLALRLRMQMTDKVPTAATDGRSLFVNPDFWRQLNDRESMGVLVHEIVHCMLDHCGRRGNRDPRAWNIAVDIRTNEIVDALPWCCLPSGKFQPVRDDAGQYDGLTEEDIYARIYKPTDGPIGGKGTDQGTDQGGGKGTDQDGTNDGKGDGAPTDGEPTDGTSTGEDWQDVLDPGEPTDADPRTASEVSDDWRRATMRELEASRARGDLPGCMEEFADAILNPQVDYAALLQSWIDAAIQSDYDWMRPADRWLSQGTYLPRIDSDPAFNWVVLAVDTSGSVSTKQVRRWIGEALYVCAALAVKRVTLVTCDSRIGSIVDLDPDEECPDIAISRGGTSFIPVFDWVDRQEDTPTALLYYTDLGGPAPDAEPDYPVLWMTTERDLGYYAGQLPWRWGEVLPCMESE